ncbi:hypothetical protein BU23DRAFT_560207 [Bimuria novae-zelandiae CBS 107.79]|uniref:Integral membrane protein n=1 Tax=Bimuria novae-zelandiae CBS 107.79 TaxID=1447943 RepID=A0A6A5UZ91_9PLEO|nr:hypothetical protein BU23DRAFT_560207 [Bimuria novae-zelandiae CBS 107.79]
MPSPAHPLLRFLATLFGTIFLGFGFSYTFFPRRAYASIGLPALSSSTTSLDAEILDAVITLFGAKDVFVGVALLVTTWVANRRVAGVLLVAASACAGVDGWVVQRVAGSGGWNHWGYGVVMGCVGVLMGR